MTNMKKRVPAEHYKKMKRHYEEIGMTDDMELIPVDLYGKRVILDKNNPNNAQEVLDDVNEVYGLSKEE